MANITLGSSASSVTFSNIPNTYRDLVVVGVLSPSANYTQVALRVNSDSGSNYSNVAMVGKSWSPTEYSFADTTTQASILFTGAYSGANLMFITQIMDYSATDKHKTMLTRSQYMYSSETATVAVANRWANTNAITSVNIFAGPGYTQPFATGSTFALYGVIA